MRNFLGIAMSQSKHLFFAIAVVFFAATIAEADLISVNFHVEDDTDAQAAHEFDGVETAGVGSFNTSFWNNVGIGAGGNNTAAAQIFAPATLFDDSGNSSAATLTSTLAGGASTATRFGGYAASSAAGEAELTNGISDDNLFNSYLALNGPNGDGSPTDNFVLDIAGLGAPFTANGYSLVIYSDTDRGPTTSNSARTSVFTLTEAGGAVSTSLTEDDNAGPRVFDGNYILSDGDGAGTNYSNYTIISGLSASAFTLEVTSPNGGRGGISGFQIVANVPEPGSAIILSAFGLSMIVRRRR